MPLFFENSMPHDGVLGLWRIDENEDYFRAKLVLTDEEQIQLDEIKGEGRRIQWLAVRYLLHHLSGRPKRTELAKDKHGKPYLPDSEYFISISHSHEMAAVLAAKVPCGVDIQYPVSKIERLVPRFCSSEEQAVITQPHALSIMHVIWGLKECIYKAYGLREVDYREHINIRAADTLLTTPGIGTLTKDNFTRTYDLNAEIVIDYILTYCFEKQ